MNSFELRLTEAEYPNVRVIVDGRDLIDRLRRIELALAATDHERKLAGTYSGLQPYEWADLPMQEEDGRAAVLGCVCGVVECWPFRVRIQIRPQTVIWSDFEGPHGSDAYASLGRFIFSREQYDAAVAKAVAKAG